MIVEGLQSKNSINQSEYMPRQIVLLGDSRLAVSTRFNNTNIIYGGRSIISWMSMLYNQRFTISAEDNLAQIGHTTEQANQQSFAAELKKPAFFVYLAHTNDLKPQNGPIPVEKTLGFMREAWLRLLSTGRPVLCFLDLPRSDDVWETMGYRNDTLRELKLRVEAVNNNILDFEANHSNFFAIDCADIYYDRATGQPLPLMSTDGTHPSTLGAYKIAKYCLLPLIESLFPKTQGQHRVSCNDEFNASHNFNGNLIRNALFLGKNSPNSSLVSGLRPDYWTIVHSKSAFQGLISSSVDSSSDGLGNWWRLELKDLRNGASVEHIGIRQLINLDVDHLEIDHIEALVVAKVSSNSCGLSGLNLRVAENDGVFPIDYHAFEASDGDLYWPSEELVLTLRTPRIYTRTPRDPAKISLDVRLFATVNATKPVTASISWRLPQIRMIKKRNG